MIILVRHGETVGNAARVVQREDVPLNERGMQQAEQLAQRLLTLGFGQLLCSDLLRAKMTAAPLLARASTRHEYSPLLQERNMGDLRGRPYSEFEHDIFARDYVPPGGESWDVFHERVDRAWQYVVGAAAGVEGNLVVITHGLVCEAIARRWLALPAGQALPARWSNASVTVCAKAAPHGASLLNCIAHLDALELDPRAAKI